MAFYIGAGLVAFTLLLYWPTVGYDYVNADDYWYICQNQTVLEGISWAGIKWAFWTMSVGNWHPLTWISHMLDCSVYGSFPGGHHLTNVFFHAADSVLLFWLLRDLTGKLWPSALVAALFAWHPLHVESVAWISERKDVLSTFFFMLTLGVYSRYVKRPTRAKFFLALALFALGLMSKPMLVTLPCVLLLLDYWPLNRSPETRDKSEQARRVRDLVVEKTPFFFLSFLGCVLTFMAQSASGAVKKVDQESLSFRFVNAVCSYGLYIFKAIWPAHLAIFYPMPRSPSWDLFVPALLALAACSVMAVVWRRRFPWLLVGWLWFLGTLVPVIGLVQAGSQSMADRYTYIPYIGLFIIIAWALDALLRWWPAATRPAILASAGFLLVYASVARIQIGYWRNAAVVFSHALTVTPDNHFSSSNLSYALAQMRGAPKAVPRFKTVLPGIDEDKSHPVRDYSIDSVALYDDAEIELLEGSIYDPNSSILHNNLGIVYVEQERLDEALLEFREAIRLAPQSPWAYLNAAWILRKLGRTSEADADESKARALRPASWSAHPP